MKALLLVLAVVLVDEWEWKHAVDVAPDGITKLDARFGSSTAVARIRTIKLEEDPANGGGLSRGFHCSGGRTICSPVVDLQLEVDGNGVQLSPSVFADLADANRAEIRQTGEAVTLVMQCGDASASYSVRIEFDEKRVRKRQVIRGFGTNEVLEETTYFEVTDLD